jgi:hypothetical protein
MQDRHELFASRQAAIPRDHAHRRLDLMLV